MRLHLHRNRIHPEGANCSWLTNRLPALCEVQEHSPLCVCVCERTSRLALCYVNLGEPGPFVYNHQEDITSSWWHREAQKKNKKYNLVSISPTAQEYTTFPKGSDILQRKLTTHKNVFFPSWTICVFYYNSETVGGSFKDNIATSVKFQNDIFII